MGDLGLISGLARLPGHGNGYSLQYSGLENSVDSAWGHKGSDMTERLSTAQSESTMIAIEVYLLPILK